MRHLRKIAKLGRNSGHRKALLVNMACSLIEHDQIETTVNRAKEVRRLVDRLITYGKKAESTIAVLQLPESKTIRLLIRRRPRKLSLRSFLVILPRVLPRETAVTPESSAPENV